MKMTGKREMVFLLCMGLLLNGCGGIGKASGQSTGNEAESAAVSAGESGAKKRSEPETSDGMESPAQESGKDSAGKKAGDSKAGTSGGAAGGSEFVMLHPRITAERRSDDVMDENDMYTLLSSIDYETVTLNADEETEFPELAAALASYAMQQRQEYREAYREMKDYAAEDYEELKQYGGEFFAGYEDVLHSAVTRSDSILFSVREEYYNHTGGMHGMYGASGVTFDSRTGERLCAADILKDPDAAAAAVMEKLGILYPDLSLPIEAEELAEEIRSSGKGEVTSFGWAMDGSGMTFYFAPYLLGGFADGMQEVLLSYEEYPEIFAEAYAAAPEDYIVPLAKNTGTEIALSYPRIPAVVNMSREIDEYGDYTKRIITIQDRSWEFIPDYPVYGWDPYLVKRGERVFLYSFDRSDNDYTCLSIFELTGGEAVQLEYDENMGPVYYDTGLEEPEDGYYGDVRSAFTDPEEALFATRLNALSTYGGVRTYRIGKAGIPEAGDDFYTAASAPELTLKKDMVFVMSGEDGSGTGEKRFPAGTVCTIFRTDAESCVDFIINGDPSQIGRLSLDLDDWPQMIGGEAAAEIFDGMIFAG